MAINYIFKHIDLKSMYDLKKIIIQNVFYLMSLGVSYLKSEIRFLDRLAAVHD